MARVSCVTIIHPLCSSSLSLSQAILLLAQTTSCCCYYPIYSFYLDCIWSVRWCSRCEETKSRISTVPVAKKKRKAIRAVSFVACAHHSQWQCCTREQNGSNTNRTIHREKVFVLQQCDVTIVTVCRRNSQRHFNLFCSRDCITKWNTRDGDNDNKSGKEKKKKKKKIAEKQNGKHILLGATHNSLHTNATPNSVCDFDKITLTRLLKGTRMNRRHGGEKSAAEGDWWGGHSAME